jgi:3(or 17)beta-hydroxysteroid dehydrogenase
MGRLEGKVAIVTGGAKGLGKADCLMFAREGARVIVTDVDQEGGRRVAEECGPGRARFVRQDVREESGWEALIDDVMAIEGRLDILVNNAGILEMGTIETTSTDAYRLTMAIHVDGTFFGCKYAIPALRKSGGGSIINMASLASIQGEHLVAAYCAAKGAIESLTRAIAVHCAQNGNKIRCNSVHPASIDTPMVQSVPGKLAAAGLLPPSGGGAALASPVGQPDDVAYAVLYLASDESKFVSGQRLIVDNTMSVTTGYVPDSAKLIREGSV